ncbi:hypothetical protein FDECE_3707 [Fusarium decemcellulare]|nr:hypothetical protein FDECE_3707 [Fusarium decemcellulare]
MGLWILEPESDEVVPGTVHLQKEAEKRIRNVANLKHGTGRYAAVVLAPQPSDSPNDPLNWSQKRKLFTSIFLSMGTGMMAGTHNYINPANKQMATIFSTSISNISQSVSVILLTLGVSALISSPAARIWGKRPVLIISNFIAALGYIIVVAPKKSLVALFVGRAIHGFGIAGLEYLVSSSVGDLFFVHERGAHLALWHYGLSGGNAIGQPIGTAIFAAQGWKWPFIYAIIVYAVYTLTFFFTCPETTYNRPSQFDIDIKEDVVESSDSGDEHSALGANANTEEKFKTTTESKTPSDVEASSTNAGDEAKYTYWQNLRIYNGRFSDESLLRALITPWSAFLLPAVSWAAYAYGCSVAFAASFSVALSQIFTKPPYSFTSSQVGLTVFSSFVGATLGNAIPGPVSDWLVTYLSKKNKGVYEPEFRVVLAVPSLIFGLVGFWGFGWSLEAKQHYMVPVFFYGLSIFAGAINSLISNTYLLDCHRAQAQDGYAAVTITRGIFSFAMTFVVNSWIERDGYKVVFFWIGSLHGIACVIGIFLYFYGKKALHLILARWSRTYGDFFSYYNGTQSVFVVSSADAFDELFNKKGTQYNSRPQSSHQTQRVTGNSRNVMMPYGEPWKDRRRVHQTLLSGQNAKMFQPYQDYESKVALINIANNPKIFFREAARYASSVTFSMLLGARFENSDSFIPTRIREEMILFWQHISPGVWLTDWFPFLNYLPSPLAPGRKRADWMHDRWVGFWGVFFDRMNERHKKGVAQDCFLTRFLDDVDVGRYNYVESVGFVADLLSAGSETTITSVQWFFRAAVYFPEPFKRAQQELDEVVGPERLPEWHDRPNLPYVDALIQELHRWASISPVAVAHATTDADVYRGYRVPKGATVIANTYGVHHDGNTYAEPHRFIPERFLSGGDQLSGKEAANMSKHFAFGVGRRACPGIQVANASLYIALSRILWAFDISAGPSGPPRLETGKLSPN